MADRMGWAPTRQHWRVLQERPSLRRPILKPRKIVVKGRLRRVAARKPLTTTLGEDSAAPIEAMARTERCLSVNHALVSAGAAALAAGAAPLGGC
jgi:hypothetical protein